MEVLIKEKIKWYNPLTWFNKNRQINSSQYCVKNNMLIFKNEPSKGSTITINYKYWK